MRRGTAVLRPLTAPLREFLSTEAAGGVVLLAAAAAGLVWANVAGRSYHDLWHRELTLGVGGTRITEGLREWVNDGLMTLFFFVVGLEIKRELVTGELRDRRTATLPALAALGGMVVPALIYLAIGRAEGPRGWGIPMATDIAFAVGVISVLGNRAPSGLRIFLLSLAIVDDIGAIAVIAVFYTDDLHLAWLLGAVAALAATVVVRRAGVSHPLAYVPLGAAAWLATFESGVHATIAGVALGLLTPARPVRGRSVLVELEHRLHPWTSFLIVPLFGLANAGVALGGSALSAAVESRVTWGVALGLLIGKTVGITGASVLAVRAGWGRLPEGVRFDDLVGGAVLGGLGFTVALFVADLAFAGGELLDRAKVGILAGSLASGLLGAVLIGARANPARRATREQAAREPRRGRARRAVRRPLRSRHLRGGPRA